jgi:serine protease Do
MNRRPHLTPPATIAARALLVLAVTLPLTACDTTALAPREEAAPVAATQKKGDTEPKATPEAIEANAPAIDPRSIDIRPGPAVRYATARVSPAVVRLDVVTENFVNGQSRASRSIGSGVIIDREGHILTNFHVAGRAKRIDITLANQEHVRATLVGSDHWTDLALVQLDLEEVRRKGLSFDFAVLGSSSEIALGQPVMAVGTPFGLSRTVTSGIISNTDRFFDETNIEGYETGWFNNWIQMDAAINPGNSGGPLINLRGEVIGINTRGFSEGNNLGFAIPIDTAKEVVAELLTHKKVTRSYIGVTLQPLQDLEKFYEIEGNQGVLVASVERNSPAERAGIKAEDILLSVNDKPVNARFPEQLASVRKLIANYPVATPLQIKVRRGMTPGVTTVTTRPSATPDGNGATAAGALAATRPADTMRSEVRTLTVTSEKLESTKTEEIAAAPWGLSVRDLTRAYLRENRLPPVQGVLVTGTRPGSPADRAQIRVGDIVMSVGDKKVTSADELQAALAEWEKAPRTVLVAVTRDRGQIELVVRP